MLKPLLTIFFYFALTSCCFAENKPVIKEIPELGVTEVTLNNGLRFCLKPVKQNEEEVSIQLFAVGGLAAFPESTQISGSLSPAIVMESGVGKMSGADITKLLFDQWFDFSIKIQPYQRIIEAGCFAESLPYVFDLIQLLFTEPKFEQNGIAKVVEQIRDSIQHRQQDCDALFEDKYMAINTQGLKILQPLPFQDLHQVNLQVAQEVFKRCFSDPKEFTCVIVGDFSKEKIVPLIVQNFEKIKSLSDAQTPLKDQGIGIPFPKGISSHEVICGDEEENNTRICIPLVTPTEEKKIHELEFITQIIETRLREAIRQKMGTTQGIDVGYEFPQYPHLETKWITVQFRSEPADSKTILNLTLQELEKLRKEGPSASEVKDVKLLLQRTDEFWANEGSYWLATLSNYYKWDWNLLDIITSRKAISEISENEVKPMLIQNFSLDQYTILMRQSQKI